MLFKVKLIILENLQKRLKYGKIKVISKLKVEKGEKNMKKKIVAAAYVVVGFLGTILGMQGIVYMYFSSTFLPVYIGSTYVVGNQVLRYGLYAVLAAIAILSCGLACYGIKFFIKRFRKIKRA